MCRVRASRSDGDRSVSTRLSNTVRPEHQPRGTDEPAEPEADRTTDPQHAHLIQRYAQTGDLDTQDGVDWPDPYVPD